MKPTQRYKDPAKNAFTKSNLYYSSSPFIGIQDPTVFGFKLFFEFDQITSPLLYGLNGDITQAPKNTAAGFLTSIRDGQRLYYLQKFIYLLSGINSQTPWYFQTLAGLKDAWTHDLNKPYIGDDKKLEIECYDSIDLRVTALMDLYRKACFDWKYRREVIPKNLRQFRLSVFLYEARWIQNSNAISLSPPAERPNFGYGAGNLGEASKRNAELVNRLIGPDETRNDPNTNNVNTVVGTPMSTTRNLFSLDFCEFNFDEPGHLETINNMEPAEVKQKMRIFYKDVEEYNLYNFWLSTDPVTDGFIKKLDRIALDDPNIEEPGTPTERQNTPPINAGPPSPGVPGGPGAGQNIEADGQDRSKRISRDDLDTGALGNSFGLPPRTTDEDGNPSITDTIASELRRASLGTVDKAQNLIDRAARTVTNGDLLQATGSSLAERAIRAAERAAQAEISGLFLGNVYGFSPGTIAGAGGAEALASLVSTAGSSILNASGTPPSGSPGGVNQSTNYGSSLNNDNRNSGYSGIPDTNPDGETPGSIPDGADFGNSFDGSTPPPNTSDASGNIYDE